MATTTTATTASTKTPARVALINLDPPANELLRDCFQQARIHGIVLTGVVEPRLAREKFQAFVVPLNDRATGLLETIRSSTDNKRAVVYGVAATTAEALPFARHGINALFHSPLEREAAAKVVHSTQGLINGEMRLYVRVPLVTEVKVEVQGRRSSASSREVSGGGIAFTTTDKLAIPQSVGLTFTLPGMPMVSLNAVVSYLTESDSLVGVRFAPSEARQRVKKWVEDYLGIVSK